MAVFFAHLTERTRGEWRASKAAHSLAQAGLAERWETEKWNTFFCPLCFCLPKGGRGGPLTHSPKPGWQKDGRQKNGILFSALFVSACQRGAGRAAHSLAQAELAERRGAEKMEYFFLPSLFLPAKGGRGGLLTHSPKPSWQKEGGQKKWNTFSALFVSACQRGFGAGCSPTRPSLAGRKMGDRKMEYFFLPSLFLPAKGGQKQWNTFFCPLCFCLPKGVRGGDGGACRISREVCRDAAWGFCFAGGGWLFPALSSLTKTLHETHRPNLSRPDQH